MPVCFAGSPDRLSPFLDGKRAERWLEKASCLPLLLTFSLDTSVMSLFLLKTSFRDTKAFCKSVFVCLFLFNWVIAYFPC